MLLGGALLLASIGLGFAFFGLDRDESAPQWRHSEALPDALTPDLDGERIAFLAVSTDVAAARLLAEWFNEDTGAVVEVRGVGYDQLLDHILADNLRQAPRYDVVEIWYPHLAYLVEAGALRDITPLVEANESLIEPDDFFEAIYTPYTSYKGRQWALPFDVDTQLLFYRRSLLTRHGFEPPRTWDQVAEIARTITREEQHEGIVGLASMGFPTAIINVSTFLNRLAAHGGDFFDDRGRPALQTPEALAALEDLVAAQEYALSPGTDVDYEIARDAFLGGRVAMTAQWTDLGFSAEDPRYSTVTGDWGVVRMPMGRGDSARHAAALNAGFSLALSPVSTSPEVAEAFLLYAASPQIQKRLNLSGTGIDVGRHSVVESRAFRDQAPEMAEVLKEAYDGHVSAWPVRTETPGMMDQLSAGLAEAVTGEREPEAVLETVQQQWYHEMGPDPRELSGQGGGE